MDQNDEFELLSVTPIRRLERELRQMKDQIKGGDSQLALQVVEILRTNQNMVEQLALKQGELVSKLSETNSNLQKLVASLDNLVELISAGAEDEAGEDTKESRASRDRLDKIVDQNAILINSLNILSKEMGKLGPPTAPGEGDQ